MNLAKAFVLTKRTVPMLGDTYHGIKTNFPTTGSGPAGVQLTALPTSPNHTNLFDLLFRTLVGTGLPNVTNYDLDRILPQILLGHRLWCEAAGTQERFIEIDDICLRDDRSSRNCWVRFDLLKSDCSRLGYSQSQVISGGHLQPLWRAVKCSPLDVTRFRFEMITPEAYTHRPSDVTNGLVSRICHQLWRSVTIVKPFRKYYVYLADAADPVIPQLCSIYLVLFYLGSITRYRPNHFDDLIAGPFGAFIQEFIENQPNQWCIYSPRNSLSKRLLVRPWYRIRFLQTPRSDRRPRTC
jgi:hypothetical protein